MPILVCEPLLRILALDWLFSKRRLKTSLFVWLCCRRAGCVLWHLLKQPQSLGSRIVILLQDTFVIRCGVRSTAFIFSLFLICDMNSSESCCLPLNCRNVWSQTAQSPGPSWDSLVHWNDSFNGIYYLQGPQDREANSYQTADLNPKNVLLLHLVSVMSHRSTLSPNTVTSQVQLICLS